VHNNSIPGSTAGGTRRRRVSTAAMCFVLIAGFAACGGDAATAPVRVNSLSLSTTALTMRPGDTARVSAVPRGANSVPVVGASIRWSSGDSTRVTVTPDGVITAIRASTPVTVTASIDGKAASLVVTVIGLPATITILRPAGIADTVRGVRVRFPLRAEARDELGRIVELSAPAVWTSTDSTVATIDSTGRVRTQRSGRTEIRMTSGNVTARWTAEVVRMRRVTVDSYLATPGAGALWQVPVVLIEFLPTADGSTIDTLKNPGFRATDPISLDSAEKRILTFAQRRKMGVEQGSRFRGYKDTTALPSLGYQVVEHIIVYDLTPPSPLQRDARIAGSPAFPDWIRIFADLNLEPVMRARSVREIWIAESGFDKGYFTYNPAVHDSTNFRTNAESNMSSPVTGDISNSFRVPNDLPILGHTYIVYGINYRRSQAEALHNVGHQLEAMMAYVSQRQVGNDRLFWTDFVGRNAQGQFTTGRAGWTHMPPNTVGNYDYLNATQVASDIEDWRPDGTGTKKPVSVSTWGTLRYPWPGIQEFDQRVEAQWYTYWFQNFPGRGNRIPSGAGWMTNWWAFVGDWDAAIRSGLRLSGASPAATVGSSSLPLPVLNASIMNVRETDR